MKGYIKCLQWYAGYEHLYDLIDPTRHKEDTLSMDMLIGVPDVVISQTKPSCGFGEIIYQLEDDLRLTTIETNFDSTG